MEVEPDMVTFPETSAEEEEDTAVLESVPAVELFVSAPLPHAVSPNAIRQAAAMTAILFLFFHDYCSSLNNQYSFFAYGFIISVYCHIQSKKLLNPCKIVPFSVDFD